MNIETGYFANWRKYKGKEVVGIVRFPPIGFKGRNLVNLAPPEELLKAYKRGKVTEVEFAVEYKSYLKTVDILGVLESLGDGNFVLCCFEKVGDFCHRHILSQVLRDDYNIVIKEAGGTENESI